MKRTTLKKVVSRIALLAIFLISGLMYSNQANAQSFFAAEPSQLSGKTAQSYDFVDNDDAFNILSQEIKQLILAAGGLSGSAAAVNQVKTVYYTDIMERVGAGDAVGQAIINSHGTLLAAINSSQYSINATNIVNAALALLTT